MASINALDMYTFLTIMIVAFALLLFVAGIFTAYFGSGKSRKIGLGLTVGGVVIGLVWIILISTTICKMLFGMDGDTAIITLNSNFVDIIVQALVVILAALAGAAIAIAIFLGAIMKA